MNGSDRYVIVTAKFRYISSTGNSFVIEQPPTRGHGTVLIARSLIHAADDSKMIWYGRGDEITFRLVEWKAKEIGLA